MCVAPVGAVVAGSSLMIADCSGAVDQQWELNGDLTIASAANPALCLAAPENEWGLTLAACDATAATQQWTRG
jgi:hypothetical protein